MKNKFSLLLALVNIFGCIASSYSQTIKGKVTDYETGQPLSYVNVGIPGKNRGTVTDTIGTFELTLPNETESDSLVLSLIGYESVKIPIQQMNRQEFFQFRLKQHTYQMQEVMVSSKRYKFEKLGNQVQSKRKKVGIGRDQLGAELGTLIQLGSKPAYLEKASFYIAKNDYGKIRLRLNVYSFKDGSPGESLLNKPVYIETDIKVGLWTVDLAEHNIALQGDFLVSLEYIQDMGFQGLYFSFDFNNAPSYLKATSQAEWKKIEHNGRSVGASFLVVVSYQKE
jgi:hypothetical protein